MTTGKYWREVLQLLYKKCAKDALQALDYEILARELSVPLQMIHTTVNYLEEKGYVVLKSRQIRTRIYYTIHLTTKGTDFIEGRLTDEKTVKNPPPSIPFKLQLHLRSETEFEVHALETPLGEPHSVSRLPYTRDELATVLKVLRLAKYEANRFTPEQRNFLEQRELLHKSRLMPDLFQRIGQTLYETLMSGDVHTAFQVALNQARVAGSSVSMQLRFDEDAAEIARYPWELLYHRRALLSSRAVELTRYISYPEAVTALPVASSLRLLYISSRPTNLPTLPDTSEHIIIRQALQSIQEENILEVTLLVEPTYEALLNKLETDEVHILHFDGHGVFARQCPECISMNYPHLSQCAICNQEITEIKPQGYLAFENTRGQVHWISSETLGALLYNRLLRLVVLSACWSSSVDGEELFGGTAPALIQAGIPAVASMQLPVRVDTAVKFMRGFYTGLARFESIPAAVNAGRMRLLDTKEWFIPTLYLRSRNDEGNLFLQK